MNLAKELKDNGYDLIESPIRNQKLLQLWLKQTFEDIDFYYDHVNHALKSEVYLNVVENTSLQVDSTYKVDYKFNIGLSIVGKLLQSVGLGALDLSQKFSTGKRISISYDNSVTKEVPRGTLDLYFSNCDLKYKNQNLLRNLNRANVIVVSGILMAKNLVVEIETEKLIESGLEIELNEMANSNASFTRQSDNILKMNSVGDNYFPVAVKLHRIDFDRGRFDDIKLVSDNRNFFD